MLGSVLRVLIFGAIVVGLAWGATYLVQNPGGIIITWGGREYPPISSIEFVLGILAICVALVLLFKLTGLVLAFFRFLAGDDNAIRRFFDRSRERKGLEALSASMIAVAAGDAPTARARAERAERLLERPELTRLLNAQAAELAGDADRARLYWRALASEPETQYIGVKGLLGQAIKAGDNALALKLAERAFDIRPQDGDVLSTLYRLQIEGLNWDAARRTVQAQRRAGVIDKDAAPRLEAQISLMEAAQAEGFGEIEHARKLAIEAAKRDPSSVDAVVTAARHLTASGSLKIASRLLIDAWRLNPHPDIAAAYAAIEPTETPAARARRFAKLFEANPGNLESICLKAELALVAGDWRAAKAAAGTVPSAEITPRLAAVMAAIARAEGKPEPEVRGWLARALGAGGGPVSAAGAGTIDHAALLPLIIGPEPEPEAEPEPEPEAAEAAEAKPAA